MIEKFRIMMATVKIVLKFATGQALVQFVGVFAGVIILWTLTPEEYAIYVVVGSILSVASITCDLGSSGALIAFSGKARTKDERKSVLGSVLILRSWFMKISVIAACLLMLLHPVAQSIGIVSLAMLIFLIGLTVFLQSRAAFLKNLAAIRDNLDLINHASVVSGCARIISVSLILVLPGNMGLWIALGASILAVLILVVMLAESEGMSAENLDPLFVGAILRYAKPLWMGHAYSVVQGVLPLFALGFAAGATSVAEFGALSRLSQVVMLASPITLYVIMPYVSRGIYSLRAAVAFGFLLMIAIGLVTSGLLFAEQYVLLLGSSYSHLNDFVPIVLLLVSLTLINDGCYQILLAGGHTKYQWIASLGGIMAQVTMLTTHTIRDLNSAYMFLLATVLAPLVVHLCLLARSVQREWKSPRNTIVDMGF